LVTALIDPRRMRLSSGGSSLEWGVNPLLRHALRSVSILALLAGAGCSAVSDWGDRMVGNTYHRDNEKQSANASGLSIPPDVNSRPNLPPPGTTTTTTTTVATTAPNELPVSPVAAQMAAAQTQLQTNAPTAPSQMASAPSLPTQSQVQSASVPGASAAALSDPSMENYLIGPGDNLDIFVWRNPDLTAKVPVRPDGKISIPLVEDVVAVGKTPSTLAREIEEKLKAYVKEPIVTVVVSNFVGPFSQQVRVIGEAAQPRALPYRANLTVLDVMIEVGGLTRFAAGDRAIIVRNFGGKQESIKAHLDDLIKDGDIEDNVKMRPGDILIIPQRYF
jgi:polysaccharide biosynthesis/export protein